MAREAKDILLKYVAAGLRGGFPAALGLDLPPIVEVLPAELPILQVRAEQPDRLFRLADGSILHLEFQMTLPESLRRFYHYQVAASEFYDTPVYTVVLYGPGISAAPETLPRGSALYQVRNVFLGQREGEDVLARLRDLTQRGKPLSEQERVALLLLPLMRQQRPLLEVLREVALLARAWPDEERDTTLGTMVGLAYTYLEPGMAEQLLEVLRMANALQKLIEDTLARGLEEGRVEGQAEGRVEGFREAVRYALRRRFGQLPPTVEATLAGADEATLARMLDRAPSAAQPEDVLDAG